MTHRPFKLILAICLVLVSTILGQAQTHPRLFFDATTRTDLRAKANTAPWSDILAVTESAVSTDQFANSWFYRPVYYAALYTYKGDAAYATKARDLILQIISTSDWRTNSESLTSGTMGTQVAIAYDLCYDAWEGQTVPSTFVHPVTGSTITVHSDYVGLDVRTAISKALKDNADRLIASGGSGWPGDMSTGNNWNGVRFGGAGLCYLATDDTVDSAKFSTAVTKLTTYFKSNLGSGADSRGWNVEGLGYLGFPGQTSMPFVLALQRNTNSALGASYVSKDLRTDIPGLKYTLQTQYPGALPQTRRHPFKSDFTGIGLRPEFNDDHPLLLPEGTAALAFALAPSEYQPALKWMFRRFWGDIGDQTWDMVSGNPLWSLLYYPDSLTEQNPADVWGLTWKDASMGMFVMRNRYQDANDTVFQATANLRPTNGGHGGPDDLSFRLWSLGVPWVVGAGRNYTNPVGGQTTLSPDDPSTITSTVSAINNSVADSLLRAAGDGYLVFKSDQLQTGSENVTRRYAVDYNSALTGATATVIVSDTTGNAATYWRMNTPSFNTITTDDTARTFTFTSPDGKTMRGTVLWPTTVTFRKNSAKFDRTHVRFPYKDRNFDTSDASTNWIKGYSTGNNWVDFQTTDGKVVVALTVVDNGGTQPTASATGTGNDLTITVGTRVFTLSGDAISASGWERPAVAITSPAANQNYNAGATSIALSGTASVPSGSTNTLDRVEIYLDDVLQGNATLSSGTWSYSLSSVAVGSHKLSARAVDSAKNERTVDVTVKVNNSTPPVVAITWPGPTQQLYDQQTVTLRGTVSDPDGTISNVEIYWDGTKLGNATLGTGSAAGTWSYAVPKKDTGTYSVYARAIDNSTDSTDTDTRKLTFSRFFSDVPIYGDAGRYTSASVADSKRWRTYDEASNATDANSRLRALELANYYVQDLTIYLPESSVKHWRLRYKARSDASNETYALALATERALKMTRYATVRGPSWFNYINGDVEGDSTKVSEYKNSGAGILPTLKWHPTEANGTAYESNKLGSLTAGDPAVFDLNREYTGIPVDASNNTLNTWHDVEIKKVGKTIKVWVNNFLIMDGTDARINLAGPVGIINSGGKTDFSFDDIQFEPLDASGNAIANAAGAIAVTAPSSGAALTAAASQTVSGTCSDDDGIASVTVFDGFTQLGTATVSSSSWSYSWTVPAAGTHALWARLTDSLGNITDSAPVTVHVGTAPSGTTAVTLEQDTSVSAKFGIKGTATGQGGVSLVQIYRNGQLAGTATVTSGNWSWSTSGLLDGNYSYTTRAVDIYGNEITSSSSIVAAVQQPTASITAPAASANLTIYQPVTITTTLTDDGSINKADFYDNGRWIGTGSNTSGSTWTFTWTPQFYGAHAITVVATDNWGSTITSSAVSVTIVPDSGDKGSVLAYVGGSGQQELMDVLELSDGTILLVGVADDLAWSTATKTQLTTGTLPNASSGKTAFLMRVAADLQSVLGIWHLPAGQVHNLRWIKTTSKPGAATTGDLYLSGATDTTGGYFIGRLNNNFVNGTPTGFVWTRTAKQTATYGDNKNVSDDRFLQTWDVGGDGRVVFVDETGTSGSGGAIRIFFASATDGSLLPLSDLRASHWTTASGTLDDNNRTQEIGSNVSGAVVSAISFPSDLRSWTDEDRLTILGDGNGQIKRGKWPYDLFYPVQDKTGTTTGNSTDDVYGYTGYRSSGKFRVGGITLDRDTGDMFIGFNVQSAFWDSSAKIQQPDFEPAVIAYSSTGELKWWSRLYTEVNDANGNYQVDAGETRISLPDQYVDGLAMDYSNAGMTQLVVNARCHGNDVSNFWSGNTVAANPSAKGFQNQFTGTEGNIHISWIGKLKAATGDLQRASWLTGYWRKDVTLSQGNYSEPIHDDWPNHNLGWQKLTTTRADSGSIRVDASGRVYVVGVGPRMVTTFNAHQKLPKKTSTTWDEGNCPWNAFVRVYEPNLDTLAYSSAITGVWTYSSTTADPTGADNTDLRGCFPTTNGVLIVGRHTASSGNATGNPIPVNKVPSWAASTPTDQTGIFGKMSFLTSANVAPGISDISNQTCYKDSSIGPINFTVSDLESTAASLTVTASSSNTAILPNSGIVISGTGSDRDLTLTPAAGQTGTVTVTITVSDGAKSTSDTFTLTVQNGTNALPTCALTNPVENDVVAPGATLLLQATATDSDGTIARVEFFVDGTKVGSDTTSPYSFLWTAPATSGVATVYARAVDNIPSSTNSASAQVYVGTRSALPTIATAAAASASPVTGTTTTLTALAADTDDAESTLTYTWKTTATPSGGSATFLANGTNAAKSTTATFTKAGDYTFQVTVRDSTLGTITSTVNVTVAQTPASVTVSATAAQLAPSTSQTYTATANDQFGNTVSPAPTFTWSTSGGGTVNSSGIYTAGSAEGGPYTVTATTANNVSGSKNVTIAIPQPTVFIRNTVTTNWTWDTTSTVWYKSTDGDSTYNDAWVDDVTAFGSIADLRGWNGGSLTVGAMRSAHGLRVDPDTGGIYGNSGTGVTLGAGGITHYATSAGSVAFYCPITLAYDQTWQADSSASATYTITYTPDNDADQIALAGKTLTIGNRTTLHLSDRGVTTAYDYTASGGTIVVGGDLPGTNGGSLRVGNVGSNDRIWDLSDTVVRLGSSNLDPEAIKLGKNGRTGHVVRFAGIEGTGGTATSTNYPGLQFDSNNSATGVILEIAGSGSYVWNGAVANLYESTGTRLIRMTGSGTQEFAGKTSEFRAWTGNVSLEVNAGTVILSGNKTTRSGATDGTLTVNNGGTLRVTGTAVGVTTVNSGGTLSGTGTLSHAVTVADGGKLAANLSTAPSSHTKLNLSSTLTFSGASTLVLTATGTPAVAGNVYTVLTASGGITGSVPAVQAPTGWTATAAIVGNDLRVTIVATTALESWRYTYWSTIANSGNAANTADPDGDGLANLLEYALGGDPTVSNVSILPTVATTTSGSSTYLTLTFTPQRSDVTYTVEASNNLSTWPDTTVLTGLAVGTPTTHTDTVALGAGTKRFLRLKVSQL
jgi:hypothetical protein